MKKNVKKVISFILSMLVIISTAVTPAMAAGTKEAPTEVKSVTARVRSLVRFKRERYIWLSGIRSAVEEGDEWRYPTDTLYSEWV